MGIAGVASFIVGLDLHAVVNCKRVRKMRGFITMLGCWRGWDRKEDDGAGGWITFIYLPWW